MVPWKFPNGNPMGRRFCTGSGNVTPDIEIVGIVKDAKYSSVKQPAPRLYYTPWRQSKDADLSMSFYVRTALEPAQTIPQVRGVMASLDRDLPLPAKRGESPGGGQGRPEHSGARPNRRPDGHHQSICPSDS